MSEINVEALVEEIERGLEGLPKSPWRVIRPGDMWTDSLTIDSHSDAICHTTRGFEGGEDGSGGPSWKNARHIARCSPDNIRALIAAYRRAVESAVLDRRKYVDALQNYNETEAECGALQAEFAGEPSEGEVKAAATIIAHMRYPQPFYTNEEIAHSVLKAARQAKG
jgi:hypothetical protein